MSTINPRAILLTILFVATVAFAVACGDTQPQATIPNAEQADTEQAAAEEATTPAAEEEATPADEVAAADAATDVDAEPEQPESPVAEPQFSPLSATDAAPWAASLASRRTLPVGNPAPGTGNVRGKFIADTPAARVFLAGEIYLAPVVFSEGQVSLPFISLNVGSDPKAVARSEDGEFVFENVKPGYYGIVLYTPVSQYLAPDGTGRDVLYIEVEAGQTLELGDILVH